MTQIPSLTLQQLELLKLAKKHSSKEIQLSYEFPVLDSSKPPIGHPPFIQELIDDHLIDVRVQGTSMNVSEFQQASWTEYCKEIHNPIQNDWNHWRNGFIAQLEEGAEPLMKPGKRLGQFTKVWIREISLRAVQPSSL
ncbi:hypothetical protein [Acaryochloris marina]|uniref:hypothetical protein n=1 Tax=Acaryochloris marina TaxID=155978 RepID=UPI0021C2BB41|nr:hypothetical protein [Acaryochloris marina]BDM83870.1 hypothetical protein AM10699_67310 [Acaryochloris marina MBIC10699]